MVEDTSEEALESNILYELLVYTEWPQDLEIQTRNSKDIPEEKYISSAQKWRKLLPFSSVSCPPPIFQALVNIQMPWQFAVGEEGHVVAILQEQALEIRSFRDEYGSVIGRALINRDPFPQWRKLVWSPDCTMLALCSSNGNIDVFDLIGALLFHIPNTNLSSNNQHKDFSEAIAGLEFSDLRVKSTQWSYELIVANYRGYIKAYFVSLTDQYKENHEFSVTSYYPYGISAFCYHRSSHTLLISGQSPKISNIDSSNNALQQGITLWRMLIDHPYYKLSLALEDEKALQKSTWWSYLPISNSNENSEHTVYKMSISPNDRILAAIHTSGTLSLWELPSLVLKRNLKLELQPNYSDRNPQHHENLLKHRTPSLIPALFQFHLQDINWWSNDALILARCSGAVSISSIHSLKNLLGISPEWFEPAVQVSMSYNRGFLAMECESVITKKKRSASELLDYNDDDEDSTDDEDLTLFTRCKDLAKTTMFYITDNERFRPPRKKIKFLAKTYRLLCLKSTTPEELFTRKINNEEYGEALALAKTYNLDSDLVYQKQWRKMPATVSSIQDYLSKITKRAWVLHECLERVPETIEAAKELLMYALRGTNLTALITIGKGEDHGRFILGEPFLEDYGDDYYDQYYDFEEVEKQKRDMETKKAELLKQINFSRLTLEQKQLCQCRLKLLCYLDRLTTYEAILGGPGLAEDFYDYNFFKKFRTQSGLEACINFAYDSNYQAIAAMFTYHGDETLQHRLPILNHFPETTSPLLYQSILPKLGYSENGPIVSTWTEDSWREPDWCEIKIEKSLSSASGDFATEFYESNKNLVKYRGHLTPKLLSKWFVERAHEIESYSCLIDNALDFVKLGMERNIQGLEKLLDDLKTLDVLIYVIQIDENFTLKMFEEQDDFQIVRLLMSKSDENTIIKHIRFYLLPFLDRCERREPGSKKVLLKRYLEDVSKSSLKFCRKVFENLHLDANQSDPLIPAAEDQVTIALNCIYACEKTDALKDICVIMELLPYHNNKMPNTEIKKLIDQTQDLKKHLRVAELLDKNGTKVTVGFVKNCSDDSEEIKKLLTKLTRFAGRREPELNETEWKILLQDMLEIQKQLHLYLTIDDCYEIYLLSLLCSGKDTTIQLAGTRMQTSKKLRQERNATSQGNLSYKLPFDKSVNLVLKAAQEYFNSAANIKDPCLELAENCLKLIKDDSASIEEEKDLISAVKLLKEFHVERLPLQIRLCSDRLLFIQQCLENKINAHQYPQKMIDIAYKLRICGNDAKKRVGKVLSLVAESAFSAREYNSCMNACRQLIEGGHQEGWSICYKLSCCSEFSKLKDKLDLMSFALIYCSHELLEEILKAKAKLQYQMVCERLQFLMGDDFQLGLDNPNDSIPEHQPSESGEDNKNSNVEAEASALQQTKEKTRHVLQHTTETTKAVLSAVGDAKFWKQTIRWITPQALTWEDNSSNDESKKNRSLKLQGTCAFYSGLIDNAHISTMECNYQRYVRPDLPPSLEISTNLFRATLLEDFIKGNWSNTNFNTAVITDLSAAYLTEEMDVAFSYIMCLKNMDEFEELFSKFPNTPIVLQFASFCLAFKICVYGGILNLPSVDEREFIDIGAIIRQAEEFMNSNDSPEIKNDSEIQQAYGLLIKYNKMLCDFIQAEILHSIGGGVDAERFSYDDVYKKDTILGIAMTSDDRVFDIAVSLAHHYKLSLWDVYMARLEYLFSDSNISSSVLESKIPKLTPLLLKEMNAFKEKLELCIWPNISGKDHPRLQQYFSLLELCGSDGGSSKLLKKFNSAIKSLDYKLLMTPGSNSLSYLYSLLNDSNVHVFAKSASKIPTEGGFLNPSAVYCMWTKKYFFDETRQKIPQTTTDWIHRYESCNDMIQRLSPGDFLKFINYVVFSEKSLQKLTLDCRSEIIKRALKFCKQKNAKNKEDVTGLSEWSDIIKSLHGYQRHLQRMDDPILVQLYDSTNPQVIAYVQEFDLSQSNIEKLKKLLLKIVLEGPDLSFLTTLLGCCPAEIEWDCSTVYIQAINFVLAKIRNNEVEYFMTFKQGSLLKILENILLDVNKNSDFLLIDDVIVDILYSFCQDTVVPVATRLQILKILEKTNYFTEEHSNLLLLYQTQAVVGSIWPEYEKTEKFTEDDVQDELQRYDLFNQLISSSTTLDHFISLAELLCHWPAFTSSYENDDNTPWTKILCHLASFTDQKGLNHAINFFDKAHAKGSLSPQACLKIFQEIVKQGSILHILKFAFKTMYEEIYNSAINILKQTEVVTEEDYDEELLDLILQRHLVVQIVPTNIYKPVIEFLLNKREEKSQTKECYSVNTIIKELFDADYKVEAGSLLHIVNQTHRGLVTYSSALNIIHRWLSK